MGTPTREDIYRLVEKVPDEDISAVFDFVLSRTDPVLRAFMDAPCDDEPLTPEEASAIDEALVDPDTLPWDEYLAKRGLAR